METQFGFIFFSNKNFHDIDNLMNESLKKMLL